MKRNKGFSFIELMIVVAIIGILSLIGLPIYNNYITKVKFTELVLKQTYLARQVEAEIDSGGAEAVYSFLKGSCTSDITETYVGWQHLSCTTNIGILPGGQMSAYLYPDAISFSVESRGLNNKSKLEMFAQYFSFVENKSISNDMHSLTYFLEDTGIYENYFIFNFVKSLTPDPNSPWLMPLQIIDKNGDTNFADAGRWYCATSFSITYTTNEYVPKSIRPSMCPYLSLSGETIFIED